MRKDIEAYSEEELKNGFIHSESVMDLAEKINNAKLLFKHQTLLGLSQLHDKKNTDYGNAATISYMAYGPIAYVAILRNKIERYKRVSVNDAMVDEDMAELLGDIINYCMMFKADNYRVPYSVNVEPVATFVTLLDTDMVYSADEDMAELLGDIINYCIMFKADNYRVPYSVNVEPVATFMTLLDTDMVYSVMVAQLNTLITPNQDDVKFNRAINYIVQTCLELLWEVSEDDNK